MFQRLPAVFRDPARFVPARVDDRGRPVAPTVAEDEMVGLGSTGATVEELQVALAAARHDPGPSDGAFGPRTEDAVRAFQRQRRLTVDGLVGPETLGELSAPLLNRFLDGLDDVFEPIVSTLDNLRGYVSVDTAPAPFLAWLAWVVGAVAPDDRSPARQRRSVTEALDQHRMRGTARGVAVAVALHLDVPSESVLVRDGGEAAWDLDPDATFHQPSSREVTVVLPAGMPEDGAPAMVALQRALEDTLPVGFSVRFTVQPR